MEATLTMESGQQRPIIKRLLTILWLEREEPLFPDPRAGLPDPGNELESTVRATRLFLFY